MRNPVVNNPNVVVVAVMQTVVLSAMVQGVDVILMPMSMKVPASIRMLRSGIVMILLGEIAGIAVRNGF